MVEQHVCDGCPHQELEKFEQGGPAALGGKHVPVRQLLLVLAGDHSRCLQGLHAVLLQ